MSNVAESYKGTAYRTWQRLWKLGTSRQAAIPGSQTGPAVAVPSVTNPAPQPYTEVPVVDHEAARNGEKGMEDMDDVEEPPAAPSGWPEAWGQRSLRFPCRRKMFCHSLPSQHVPTHRGEHSWRCRGPLRRIEALPVTAPWARGVCVCSSGSRNVWPLGQAPDTPVG
jgi:hypothetical protein